MKTLDKEMNHATNSKFDIVTLSPRSEPRAIYRSTKTYDHNEGLSCCFRQWKAIHSHCSMLHGYALAFGFVFATHELDERNWCFDFGGMKEIKSWLHHMFDHTMLVASNDPHRAKFEALAEDGLIDIRVLPAVGCEAIAKITHDYVQDYVSKLTQGRVWLESVQVREHSGNSAIYELS